MNPRWFPSKSVVSPAIAVVFNILLAFFCFSIARVEYLLENWSYFSEAVSEGRILRLMCGGVVLDTPGVFYFNAIYILMMLLPLHYKENERYWNFCKWVFITVNSLALILNVADSVYFSYTLRRTSWSIFGEFGNEANFGKILWVELFRHWYLLIFCAVMIWGMWKSYISPAMEIRKQKLWRYYLLTALSLIFAAVVAVTGIRGGLFNHWYNYLIAVPLLYVSWRLLKSSQSWSGKRIAAIITGSVGIALIAIAPIGGWRHRDIRPIALSNATAWIEKPMEASLVLNTPFSMIRSIGNVPFHDPHFYDDKAQLEALYTPIHIPSDSTKSRKKNLCIIIIESFGREYIGAMNKDILGEKYKGYTPFTDSLLNHCAWWRYSFDNGRKSIDAMPSILAGIPSIVRPFIVTPQAVNKINGLPAALNNMGYSTAFFHGARTGSMGFDAFAHSIGFKDYKGKEDFVKDSRFRGEKDFDGYWAIWDEPFLKWFALELTDMKPPFMAAVFTASNHHPFNIPEEYKGKLPEGNMPIHKTAAYTDNALREFFVIAKTQPWYKNTVFVITNDHTNMSEHPEYLSSVGAFYGPILIFDPSGEIKPGMRDAIAQQTDIMPTMLNYLGYDKPYLSFGCDLLATPAEETWALNYTNDAYQYARYGYILLFDGTKSIGLYKLGDHQMQNNLLERGKNKDENASDSITTIQSRMEQELKAIIQQYMDRMLHDRLTACL